MAVTLAGCSSGGQHEVSSGGAPGPISQDDLGKVQSLSKERPCSQVSVVSGDCAAATTAKIGLAAELQPRLRGLPGSDIAVEAVRVTEGIGDRGKEWSALGCPTNWIPECVQPAAAIETQFSALATYTVQLTDGG